MITNRGCKKLRDLEKRIEELEKAINKDELDELDDGNNDSPEGGEEGKH